MWHVRTFFGEFSLPLGPDLRNEVALEAAERHKSMDKYLMGQLGLIDS